LRDWAIIVGTAAGANRLNGLWFPPRVASAFSRRKETVETVAWKQNRLNGFGILFPIAGRRVAQFRRDISPGMPGATIEVVFDV